MEKKVIKREYVPNGEFVGSVKLSWTDIFNILIYKIKGYKITVTPYNNGLGNSYMLYINAK